MIMASRMNLHIPTVKTMHREAHRAVQVGLHWKAHLKTIQAAISERVVKQTQKSIGKELIFVVVEHAHVYYLFFNNDGTESDSFWDQKL